MVHTWGCSSLAAPCCSRRGPCHSSCWGDRREHRIGGCWDSSGAHSLVGVLCCSSHSCWVEAARCSIRSWVAHSWSGRSPCSRVLQAECSGVVLVSVQACNDGGALNSRRQAAGTWAPGSLPGPAHTCPATTIWLLPHHFKPTTQRTKHAAQHSFAQHSNACTCIPRTCWWRPSHSWRVVAVRRGWAINGRPAVEIHWWRCCCCWRCCMRRQWGCGPGSLACCHSARCCALLCGIGVAVVPVLLPVLADAVAACWCCARGPAIAAPDPAGRLHPLLRLGLRVRHEVGTCQEEVPPRQQEGCCQEGGVVMQQSVPP